MKNSKNSFCSPNKRLQRFSSPKVNQSLIKNSNTNLSWTLTSLFQAKNSTKKNIKKENSENKDSIKCKLKSDVEKIRLKKGYLLKYSSLKYFPKKLSNSNQLIKNSFDKFIPKKKKSDVLMRINNNTLVKQLDEKKSKSIQSIKMLKNSSEIQKILNNCFNKLISNIYDEFCCNVSNNEKNDQYNIGMNYLDILIHNFKEYSYIFEQIKNESEKKVQSLKKTIEENEDKIKNQLSKEKVKNKNLKNLLSFENNQGPCYCKVNNSKDKKKEDITIIMPKKNSPKIDLDIKPRISQLFKKVKIL